jgi:hypothetical protein
MSAAPMVDVAAVDLAAVDLAAEIRATHFATRSRSAEIGATDFFETRHRSTVDLDVATVAAVDAATADIGVPR